MIDKDNTRAEKDRVFTDPPLTTPGSAETAKINGAIHGEKPDLTAWTTGNGVPPDTVKFPEANQPQEP